MKNILIVLALLTAGGCATAGSRAEKNRAIARRAFSEILERGRFDLVSELYSPNFTNHGLRSDDDLAGDMEALRAWHRVFPPDTTIRPELMIAEGDNVTVLWVLRGTLKGDMLAVRGITIWRIVDGKIHDEWSEFDELSAKKQLGLIPSQAPPAAE